MQRRSRKFDSSDSGFCSKREITETLWKQLLRWTNSQPYVSPACGKFLLAKKFALLFNKYLFILLFDILVRVQKFGCLVRHNPNLRQRVWRCMGFYGRLLLFEAGKLQWKPKLHKFFEYRYLPEWSKIDTFYQWACVKKLHVSIWTRDRK